MAALKYSEPEETDEAPSTPGKAVAAKEATEDPFKDVPILHRAKGELYLFETESDVFVIQEKDVDVDMAANAPFDCASDFEHSLTPAWLIVRKDNVPFISLPIDSEMNPRFDMANHAFMFTFRETEGLPGMTWCLRFDESVFGEWKDKFTIYLWENKNRMSFAKAQAVEQRYIQDAYNDGDIEMGEVDDREAEVEAEEEEEEEYESAPEDEEASEDESDSEFAKGSKNEQLAVGYKNDMSFVTRGNMIGVFSHDRDKVKFRTAIDRVKDMDGKSFTPKKVMSVLFALTPDHAPQPGRRHAHARPRAPQLSLPHGPRVRQDCRRVEGVRHGHC